MRHDQFVIGNCYLHYECCHQSLLSLSLSLTVYPQSFFQSKSRSLGCHVFAGKVGILAFRRFRILWNRRPNNSRLYLRLNQVKAHVCGCLFCHEIFLFVSYGLEVYPLASFSSKLITPLTTFSFEHFVPRLFVINYII